MRRYLALGLALLAVGSCSPSGDDGTGPTAAVATVTVAPALDTVYIGAVTQLAATTKDADGNVLTGSTVTWSMTGTGATLSSTGLVTGTASGDVTVIATSEGITGNASIFVRPVPVVSVLLTPATDTIYLGATASFSATPRDSIGGALAGRVTNWSSLDAAASVSNVGLVTSLSLGTARIVANVEGKADTTLVTVLPVPVASVVVTPAADTLYPTDTVQVAAVTRDSANGVLAGRTVAWSSLDAAASVNNVGLVTALSVGTARIVATSEGKADTSIITVQPVPVASVVLTPGVDTLPIGEVKQFVAVPLDSIGGTLTGRTVSWTSTDTLVASVSVTGQVTARDTGITNLIATAEGKSDTALVLVTLRPLGSVVVTPASDTLQVGDSAQFGAAVLDTAGAPLTGRPVTWSSLDSTASVTAGGRVHALVIGTARIVANREGKADTALVTIVNTQVVLPPLTGTWLANGISSLDGPAIVVPYIVQTDSTLSGTWYSPGPDHNYGILDGSVHGDSVEIIFHDAGPGCDAIWTTHRVGADSLNGAFIFVGGSCLHPTNNGPLSARRDISTSQVVILGALDSLSLGDSFQFVAEARDSTGTAITDRPVTWTSGDTTMVLVDGGGMAHAVGLGTTFLIAEGQGRADTVTVTVVSAPSGGTPLTGYWAGVIYDSVAAGGGPLNLTLVQNDTLLTGGWKGVGASDTGAVTGIVDGTAIVLVFHNVNQPAGDCEATMIGGRLGNDSLLGRYEFAQPGCSAWPSYGTLSFQRSSPPGSSGEFDIAVTSNRENADAIAGDGSHVLVGYHQRNSPDSLASSFVKFLLLDAAGVASAPVVESGSGGDPPAVAFGGGGYLGVWASHDSSTTVLNGLLLNSAGAATSGLFSIRAGVTSCGVSYAGGTFGLLYEDESGPDSLRQVYFRRIATNGTLGPEVIVGPAPSICGRLSGMLATDGTRFLALLTRPDGTELRTRTISASDSLGSMQVIRSAASGLLFGQVAPVSGGWVAAWNEFGAETHTGYAVLGSDGSGSTLGQLGESIGTEAIVTGLHATPGGFVAAWFERPADPSQTVTKLRKFNSGGGPVSGPVTIAGVVGGKFAIPMAVEPVGTDVMVVLQRYTLGASFLGWDEMTGDVTGVVVTP